MCQRWVEADSRRPQGTQCEGRRFSHKEFLCRWRSKVWIFWRRCHWPYSEGSEHVRKGQPASAQLQQSTSDNSIPESERAAVAKTSLELGQQDSTSIERALGLQWCIDSDEFCFRLTLKDHPLTRRGILATVASIYDPLGLIAPLVLVGRQILQEMCKSRMDWDHPVPDELHPQWEKWRQEMLKLDSVKIPRCFQPQDFGMIKEVELHHFSGRITYPGCLYVHSYVRTKFRMKYLKNRWTY